MNSISKQELVIINHALGLDYKKSAFRNFYTTGPGTSGFPICEQLVNRGLMTKRNDPFYSSDFIYYVTETGKLAVSNANNDAPRILHLTLRRQWFDQIAAGEKHEEYREHKAHWISRLTDREYDEVHFRNGYGPGRPFMRVECRGIERRDAAPESLHDVFGDKRVFAIKLGRILEIRNWPGQGDA